MLLATAKIAEVLAGGICIASLGYSNAAVLLEEYDHAVTRFSVQDPKFLLKLLHKVDLHTKMAAQSFAEDVEKVGSNPFTIDGRYLKDLELDNDRIFHKIRRQEVDFLLLPAELAQKLVVSKRPQRSKSSPRSNDHHSDEDLSRSPARATKGSSSAKKGKRDEWCAPSDVGNPLERFFSDWESGKANRARIAAIKVRHHRKHKNKTDWSNTRLCLRFAVGLKCSNGRTCNMNHRSRRQVQNVPKDTDKVPVLDSIFSAIYH